ncbi:MAG: hypothetical protein ACOYEH_07740 [Caldicoprobacterales bacterium]
MKVIQKWSNGYAVLFAVGICLTALFAVKLMLNMALCFGVASITVLILLLRQRRLLYDASLIWDNRILAVPSAVIYILGSEEKKEVEETIVSTFGIRMGSKIYKWGCDGVHGVRLKTIEIDRVWIYLTFGNEIKTLRVKLLHGMNDKQEVMTVKEKLFCETGVETVVSDW